VAGVAGVAGIAEVSEVAGVAGVAGVAAVAGIADGALESSCAAAPALVLCANASGAASAVATAIRNRGVRGIIDMSLQERRGTNALFTHRHLGPDAMNRIPTRIVKATLA
jgi:hypothetical protein